MSSGRCACGAVTYEMSGTPIIVHCCHCRECQRQTGSAYVINALIESDRVAVSGATATHVLPSPSGEGQEISRCEKCGTAIFSHYLIRGRAISFVRAGTLDDPSSCPPDVQIFTQSKLDWVPLVDSIPSFDGLYDPKTFLSKEAAARRSAAINKAARGQTG